MYEIFMVIFVKKSKTIVFKFWQQSSVSILNTNDQPFIYTLNCEIFFKNFNSKNEFFEITFTSITLWIRVFTIIL